MIVGTLSGVVVIAIATQLFKSFLEALGCGSTTRLHDPVIWAMAFAMGIGGYILHAVIFGPITASSAWDAAGQGLLAAFSAVGTYSLVTHPYFSSTKNTPPAP